MLKRVLNKLFVFVALAVTAHALGNECYRPLTAPYWTSTVEQASTGQPTFTEFLRAHDWKKAYKVLKAEKELVEQELKLLPREEAIELTNHWAGSYSGKIISTPLEVLSEISNVMNFQPGQSLVDIGSGHGDPGIVFAALNPELKVTGFEIVKAKVDSANRVAQSLGLQHVSFVQQDLSDLSFRLPAADYFYFFNPVYPEVVHWMAEQIIDLSQTRDIKVIIYGGSWTPQIFQELGFSRIFGKDSDRVTIYQYQRK